MSILTIEEPIRKLEELTDSLAKIGASNEIDKIFVAYLVKSQLESKSVCHKGNNSQNKAWWNEKLSEL